MSLAAKVAAKRKEEKKAAEEAAAKQAFNNRYLAKSIIDAKRKQENPFPTSEIETLTEIAIKVVAENFTLYPHLKGVTDENILKPIVEKASRGHEITDTARNIDFEFYW